MSEIRVESLTADGPTLTLTYPEEAFNAQAFMDMMAPDGSREWEFGGPGFSAFWAGDRVRITLPEWEFTTTARVVSIATTGGDGSYDTVMRVTDPL